MAQKRIRDVVHALSRSARDRLMKRHEVETERKLVNFYGKNGGLRALVRELDQAELRRSLAVLDKSELQAVVYGALAFDSKVDTLIPGNRDRGNARKLRRIMKELCGWSVESFQQSTYDALIEMLNRVGVDVEKRDLEHLVQAGTRAADRKVRLRRMFAD